MQLSSLQPAQPEHDPHLMSQRLASEEDDALVLHRPLTQRQQDRRSRPTPVRLLLTILSLLPNPHKLLHQVLRRLPRRIHEQSNGLVETESNELVHRIGHGGREEHGLPRSRAGGDDLVEFV